MVFFDEPMSGLDPLGRRDLRQLMLRLRDRGCTVFFSSHILSDAEALCSRVAILAQGRLVAQGRLTDIVAFELRGWELVVANLPEPRARVAGGRACAAITPLSDDRYTLELPPSRVARKAHSTSSPARRAQIVSLNPMRTTLEDYFVHVGRRRAAADDGVSGA